MFASLSWKGLWAALDQWHTPPPETFPFWLTGRDARLLVFSNFETERLFHVLCCVLWIVHRFFENKTKKESAQPTVAIAFSPMYCAILLCFFRISFVKRLCKPAWFSLECNAWSDFANIVAKYQASNYFCRCVKIVSIQIWIEASTHTGTKPRAFCFISIESPASFWLVTFPRSTKDKNFVQKKQLSRFPMRRSTRSQKIADARRLVTNFFGAFVQLRCGIIFHYNCGPKDSLLKQGWTCFCEVLLAKTGWKVCAVP